MLIGTDPERRILVVGAHHEQMLALGRHRRSFVRVDRRNHKSLALRDRRAPRMEPVAPLRTRRARHPVPRVEERAPPATADRLGPACEPPARAGRVVSLRLPMRSRLPARPW